MLRRFLVFTLGLMALFCGTALLQERLPEPYRIFPAFADLIPSNPLRPFASGYADVAEWISSESPSDHDQTAENADEGKNADASKAEESPEAHPSHSDIQRDSATEKQLESQEKTTEGPILDSGKDFQYLESFFHKLQALEQYRDGQSEERAGSDGASEKEAGHPHIVRILHFGDSIMWGDNLSLKMKQLFQSDFGDGGRGLVNIIDSPSSELLEHKNSTRRGFRVLTIPFESFTMPRTPELGFSGGSARPNSPDSVTSHSIPEEKLNSWQSARIILGNPNRIKLKGDAPPESR
ncbi:MAG: hypothetical protein KDK25_06285, partial [Leptospiraceae bacterium]|nr:hypothetical protein [Leptospiraceae bacterium]